MTRLVGGRAPDRALVLDGGMGEELSRRGVDTRAGLWSAQALIDVPDVVTAVHADYLAAGADVITTDTYATTARRLDAEAFEHLNRRACEIARDARDAAGGGALIAGSLPPLFGSYRPDRVRPAEEIEPMYRAQAALLAPYVDLFLCETLSSAAEAQAAARAATDTGLPVWVSWTVADDASGTLRSGESIADAVAALDGLPVEALLVNCSMPESIDAALTCLAREAGRPFGAYGNGFPAIGPETDVADGRTVPEARADLDTVRYAEHALGWVERGASVVGGCCEIGPAHIAEIARRLPR